MKNKILLFAAFLAIGSASHSQGFKKLLGKDSQAGNIISGNKSSLSSDEIASGLKEALSIGSKNAAASLSKTDGFFKDAAVKVLMPEQALKVEKKLRALGMGKLVDDAILSMNRAAEDATKTAAPIFLDAIKGITIQDALGILRGSNTSATDYLKSKTTVSLTDAFRPVIESSLQKTNATKYWNTVFSTYNKFSADKVNPDLVAHVTEKALTGIFYQVGLEEQKIRKDPAARTTELLKTVFGK